MASVVDSSLRVSSANKQRQATTLEPRSRTLLRQRARKQAGLDDELVRQALRLAAAVENAHNKENDASDGQKPLVIPRWALGLKLDPELTARIQESVRRTRGPAVVSVGLAPDDPRLMRSIRQASMEAMRKRILRRLSADTNPAVADALKVLKDMDKKDKLKSETTPPSPDNLPPVESPPPMPTSTIEVMPNNELVEVVIEEPEISSGLSNAPAALTTSKKSNRSLVRKTSSRIPRNGWAPRSEDRVDHENILGPKKMGGVGKRTRRFIRRPLADITDLIYEHEYDHLVNRPMRSRHIDESEESEEEVSTLPRLPYTPGRDTFDLPISIGLFNY
jgi:hypothetical protein